MSDQTPPLPERPAAEAAARRPPVHGTPTADPDNTGVPAPVADLSDAGRGFFSALFDISFRTFITRRLASVFYLVGLIAIGIAFVFYFLNGIISGIGALSWNVGGGVTLIISTLIVVPLVTFLSIVVLRFVIESVVALIAIAENTERTAEHTRR